MLENPMDETRVRFLEGKDLAPAQLSGKVEQVIFTPYAARGFGQYKTCHRFKDISHPCPFIGLKTFPNLSIYRFKYISQPLSIYGNFDISLVCLYIVSFKIFPALSYHRFKDVLDISPNTCIGIFP